MTPSESASIILTTQSMEPMIFTQPSLQGFRQHTAGHSWLSQQRLSFCHALYFEAWGVMNGSMYLSLGLLEAHVDADRGCKIRLLASFSQDKPPGNIEVATRTTPKTWRTRTSTEAFDCHCHMADEDAAARTKGTTRFPISSAAV